MSNLNIISSKHCYPEMDCICEDSRNNTYTCLRFLPLNGSKNYLYCEFDDKIVSFLPCLTISLKNGT